MTMTEEQRLAIHIRVAEQDYENARIDAMERVRIQASLADRALQALLFANGGALIALFTFVGNVAAQSAASIRFDFALLRISFALFGVGLFLALLAHMMAFLSQDRFYNMSMQELWRNQRDVVLETVTVDRPLELKLNQQGQRFYMAGIVVATASMALFVAGCGAALWGVTA